jgi:hypothetical protein
MMAAVATWYPAMVTSGPLLPDRGSLPVEVCYLCPVCLEAGRQSDVHIWFGPADQVPVSLRLPCLGCTPIDLVLNGEWTFRSHYRADWFQTPAEQ